MSGEATVGSILGYLRLDRSDWDAELRAAGQKADELGRHNPDIRIKTNAPSAITQLAAVAAAAKRLQDAQGAEAVAEARLQSLRDRGVQDAGRLAAAEEAVAKARRSQASAVIALAAAQDTEHAAATRATTDAKKTADAADHAKGSVLSLWDALLLAPAAVPILGVATGAMIGLLPVAATVMLAVKGIEAQMKSAAGGSGQFAASVATLKGDLTTLEGSAAGGLMSGINKALAQSQGLFGQVNDVVKVMSVQLGDIVAGAAPALLRILVQLNPLFVTFGDLLTKGAGELEHWAETSHGVQSFVAYVQAQLPTVMSFLGNLIVLVSHLVQGLAPFGSSLLWSLNQFVHVLNMIPVDVLQRAIPVATALYVSLKALTLLTPGVNSIGGALKALATTLDLTDTRTRQSALAQIAASEQIRLTAAQEAAGVAEAKATEAEAAAESAVEQQAAAERVGASDAALTQIIAENAIEQAASFRAAAVSASESAATIAGEAEAAAEASTTAGEAASVGWGAMLGPVGAAVAGLGILGMSLFHTGQAAQQLQMEVNGLTDAIRQDSGAVGENTRAYIVNQLQKSGAFAAANKLGISLSQLTDTVIQGGPALQAFTEALSINNMQVYGGTKDMHDRNAAAQTLIGILTNTNGALGQAKTAYNNEKSAMSAATTATNAQATATQRAKASLDALNTSMETFAQNQLAAAQTEDQFKAAVIGVTTSVNQNGKSLSTNSTKGLANRDALISAMQAALSYRDAQEKAGVSVHTANDILATNIQQLENSAIKAGLSKSQVQALVKQMGLVPKNIRTEFETNAQRAAAQVKALEQLLFGITSHEYKVALEVQANVKNAQAMAALDRLSAGHNAGGTNDWRGGWTWVGEQGPELVNLPAHSKVLPHGPSVAAARSASAASAPAGAMSGGPAVFHLYDVNGVLIGTMRGQAQAVMEDVSRAQPHQGSRSGYGW